MADPAPQAGDVRPRCWLRVELIVDAGSDGSSVDEAVGTCAAALHEIGGLGVEEVVARASAPAALVALLAYLPAGTPLPEITAALDASGVAARIVGSGEIADAGWVEAFNRTLVPVDVGRRFTVVPGTAHEPRSGRLALRIAPGRAFGTGHHESTRLALEWLEESVTRGTTVLDVGTGSGILAAAAARLGAARAVGTDADPEAIEVAQENLAWLPERAAVRFEVADGPVGSGPVDVLVANITADVLHDMLPRLVAFVRPGGTLILAGLLLADELAMEAALGEHGMGDVAWRRAGEWSAARARRRP